LFFHKIIGKVCVNSADKPIGRIAHPDIHDVGADVLLTDRGERMAQAVSRFSATIKSFLHVNPGFCFPP